MIKKLNEYEDPMFAYIQDKITKKRKFIYLYWLQRLQQLLLLVKMPARFSFLSLFKNK